MTLTVGLRPLTSLGIYVILPFQSYFDLTYQKYLQRSILQLTLPPPSTMLCLSHTLSFSVSPLPCSLSDLFRLISIWCRMSNKVSLNKQILLRTVLISKVTPIQNYSYPVLPGEYRIPWSWSWGLPVGGRWWWCGWRTRPERAPWIQASSSLSSRPGDFLDTWNGERTDQYSGV